MIFLLWLALLIPGHECYITLCHGGETAHAVSDQTAATSKSMILVKIQGGTYIIKAWEH